MEELVKLLPPEGASVTALIVIVYLFLRHQRAAEDKLREITDRCHAAQREMREGYRESLDLVVTAFTNATEKLGESQGRVETKLTQVLERMENRNNGRQ